MLQPAHSERFSVYLVQDYQSFSQRVAIVKVVLCVCFLFPLLQNKYLPAQLLLDQISNLNKTSSKGITPFEYSINKTKSPSESTDALPLQKSIKGSTVLPCRTSS